MGFLLTISCQSSITFWKVCLSLATFYIYVLMRGYYILYWEWFLCLATWWDCETGYERNGAQFLRDDPCSWRWQCGFAWWLLWNPFFFFLPRFLLFDVHNDICCIQVFKKFKGKEHSSKELLKQIRKSLPEELLKLSSLESSREQNRRKKL